MPAAQQTGKSQITVGRSESGYVVRISGKGTMVQSEAVMAFAEPLLREARVDLVVDLSDCEYLDSTFLGCLLSMHKRARASARTAGTPTEVRFRLAGPAGKRQYLLGPTRLDVLLPAIDAAPITIGEPLPLSTEHHDDRALMRHVAYCHRQLAQVEGPCKEKFAQVADRLEQDMAGR